MLKAIFAYYAVGIAFAIFLVSCDGEYVIRYAQKKYNEVISEGKAYADSVQAVESSERRARGEVFIPTRSTRRR